MATLEDPPLQNLPNGWEPPADDEWKPVDDKDWNAKAGFDKAENVSKHSDGEFERGFEANTSGPFGGSDGCRNCGAHGHFARECPEPKKLSGECFNCGEVGHNKADCPNPKVARPFTGTCNICGVEGHPAIVCPKKGPTMCKNCKQEGHKTSECTENRFLDWSNVEDMDSNKAWSWLKKANDDKDLDEFKKAITVYVKSNPETTYQDLEHKYRENDFKIYTIGLEKEMPIGSTIVNLQGKSNCKYVVAYSFGPKPRRAKFAEGWPKSPEENIERLKDAGMVMDQVLPVCRRCNQLGHISKSCTEEKTEAATIEIECSNCNEKGHRIRDCRKEIEDKNVCRNCKKPGHKAADCEEPRSAEGIECKRCNEMGHFAKDCPNNQGGGPRTCRNCDEEGHIAKDCDKPKKIICKNCDGEGHMMRECPKPRDWSRYKCPTCGELGHGYKRCPLNQESGDGPGGASSGDKPGTGDSGMANDADNGNFGVDGHNDGEWSAGAETSRMKW